MDARSLTGNAPAEFPTPPERAEAGLTLLVDLQHGFWLGELNERPWIVHPDGSVSCVELGPPPVDVWVQLVERWLSQWPERGWPGVARPHPALARAARLAVGRWTSPARMIWIQHACGHGCWYRDSPETTAQLALYRGWPCADCTPVHAPIWDD